MTKPSEGECEMAKWEHATEADYVCGKPAKYRVDPFIDEIYQKRVRRWLCDECYDQRNDDI